MLFVARRLGVLVLLVLCALPGARAGTLLVANKAEGSITLLRSPGFEPILSLPTGRGPHEIALSPEGLRALVSNYGTRDEPGETLTLLDLAKLRPVANIQLPPGSRPHGVAWVKPDEALVTAEGLNALLVVDIPGRKVARRIPLEQDVSHMVAARRDGSAAWVANIGSGTVSEIDLNNGDTVSHAESGAGAEGLALVNQGEELWVSNREAGTVSVFTVLPLRKVADIDVGGFPIRVEADDSRGRVFVTLARDDALAVLDVAERKLLQRSSYDIPGLRQEGSLLGDRGLSGSIPVGLLLTGDGEMLFTAHTNAHQISVRNAETLEQLTLFTAGQEPDGMVWTWIDLPYRH